jgi:hypothetical protein
MISDNSFFSKILRFCPPQTSSEGMTKWIDITECCMLDTALTNSFMRPFYTKYLQEFLFFDIDKVFDRSNELLSWFSVRKMRVNQLYLSHLSFVRSGSLDVVCSSLKKLRLENYISQNDTMLNLLVSSPVLNEFYISNGEHMSDQCLSGLNTRSDILQNLEHLTFENCHNFSAESLSLFAMHCTKLVSFTIRNCSFSATGIAAILKVSKGTLEKFECFECFEPSQIGVLLRDMNEVYSAPPEAAITHDKGKSRDSDSSVIDFVNHDCCYEPTNSNAKHHITSNCVTHPQPPLPLQFFAITHKSTLVSKSALGAVASWMPLIDMLEVSLSAGEGIVYGVFCLLCSGLFVSVL